MKHLLLMIFLSLFLIGCAKEESNEPTHDVDPPENVVEGIWRCSFVYAFNCTICSVSFSDGSRGYRCRPRIGDLKSKERL